MSNDYKDPSLNDYSPFPRDALDQSIGARFEAIARRFPDKLAVRTKNHSWSYTELNNRAEGIAQLINDHGVSGPAPILLLFDHDAPGIAALLGVLKAGHFYCALDPLAPLEHNRMILHALGAKLLLCDRANLAMGQRVAAGAIPISNSDDVAPQRGRAASPVRVSPAALSYVFFTSGTTGKPKGVMGSHRSAMHNILRYTDNLRITTDDRMTLLQTLSFSGSVSSLFCALLNGGTSYPFDLRSEGPAALAAWIEEQQLTIYHSVPSIFRLIAADGRRFTKLRIVRLEGDQASIGDAALFQKHFRPPCRLVNGLGATECGIVRQFFLATDSPLPSRSLPIGHAIQDMEILLLGEDMRPAPTGEIGEIAVKSRYLAVGYWQQPELTAQVFRSATDDPDARIYCTGDLGRLDENGCLEYLGRKDFQEKVRGVRVNLAKIEAEAVLFPGIREAVAAVKADHQGENQIVVYYTEVDDCLVNPVEAWTQLQERLDGSPLPYALIKLDRLPLNANGKVDRRALPTPRKTRLLSSPTAPPKNQVEFELVAIWKEILCMDQIGVDDSFLDLGGDSLQLMRMFNRARQVFGHDVSIVDFFVAPTVSGLAKLLDRAQNRRQ
jgi:amino acid adenylation domain-containing protein